MALKNNNRKTDFYYFIRCPGVLYLRLGHRISIQTEQQEDELTGLVRKKTNKTKPKHAEPVALFHKLRVARRGQG